MTDAIAGSAEAGKGRPPDSPRLGCLGRLAALLGLFVLVCLLAFALLCHRVMNAPVIAAMTGQSGAYPCIGNMLDPRRPRFATEFALARHYLRARGVRGPSPLQAMSATWAIDASTTRDQANRMYAASPQGWFRSFDHIARTYAGKPYCALDARRRQAVLDFYWRPDYAALARAMRAEPGA